MFPFDNKPPTFIWSNHTHRSYSGYHEPIDMAPLNPEPGRKPVAETNVPDRFELFMLQPGEKKVTEAIDTRKLTLCSTTIGFPRTTSRLQKIFPLVYFCPHLRNSGIPSTSLFTFVKEDHTLGNMVTSRLRADKRVVFAGYKVPHPLFPYVPYQACWVSHSDCCKEISSFVSEPTEASPPNKPFWKLAAISLQTFPSCPANSLKSMSCARWLARVRMVLG